MTDSFEAKTLNTKKKQNGPLFERVKRKQKNQPKLPHHRRSVLRDLASPEIFDNDVSQEEEEEIKCIRKRTTGVRLSEEPLELICLWELCSAKFEDYFKFMKHIFQHMEDVIEQKHTEQIFRCYWDLCATELFSLLSLKQHVVYHGYLARLTNIGNNVLQRSKLPDCLFENDFDIPLESNGYKCEWESCNISYCTVYEFYEHVACHTNSFPAYHTKGEIICCCWKGCTCKFPSKYKLNDHVKLHTKEKIIACPTCLTLFSTKTKFCDHRKRQLPTDLQNYQCSQCSKLFATERLARDHMLSHVNPYKCTMCDMTCSKPSGLKAHIRYRHLPDGSLKCNLCEQMCLSKQALQAHLLTHFPENQMACEECDFSCRSAVGLSNHYQIAHGHGWDRTYECHCCKKQFPLGNKLTKHLMKEHNFHWPSGHSRFRYKEEKDGIFRLQIVRYESIEVTQEFIRKNNSETMIDSSRNLNNASDEIAPKYVLMFAENGEKNVVCPTNNTIVISINDVDERGKVLNSQIVQSNEMKVLT